MPKQKLQGGFSLIEILLSLLFIGAIVTILFTTTGSLFTRRGSNLQSIAAKIATTEIENLRGKIYATELLSYGAGSRNCAVAGGYQEDIAPPENKFGVDFTRTTKISCYEDPANPGSYAPEADIVNVNVKITWVNNNGGSRELSMDTLISANGL